MALTPAILIRAGSGLLFALLGLAILVVGRKKAGPVWFAVFLVALGSELALTNLALGGQWGLVLVGLLLVMFVGGIVASCLLPTPVRQGEGWTVALGLALCTSCFVLALLSSGSLAELGRAQAGNATLVGPAAIVPGIVTFFVVNGLGATFIIPSIRIARSPPTDNAGWLRAGSLAGIGAYVSFGAPVSFGDPWHWWGLAASLLIVGTLAICWLFAAARSGRRLAVAVAFGWLILGVAGYLYVGLPTNVTVRFHDAYGVNGILRLVSWSLLVYAILRADLLQVKLPRIAVSRGVVAAGALALLFMVAQIAQNFFSAEYGLLTGGVIAGTFLFAASPIQKSFERMGERRPMRQRPGRAPVDAGTQQLDAFREAVRLAFKDRRFDASEEVALARLADKLGVSAEKATQIRHEVEREKGAR